MNLNSLSERLKEERIRLKFSQSDIAQICGVSREMWGRYERSVATPGGEVLMILATEGADVNYLLTGERKQPPSVVLEPEEQVLLKAYKELPDKAKKDILLSIMAGGSSKKDKVKNKKERDNVKIKGDSNKVQSIILKKGIKRDVNF